jgi:energy-coupling factor transporter transmembrane protein EcfT
MGTWKPIALILAVSTVFLMLFGIPFPLAFLGGVLILLLFVLIGCFYHLIFNPLTYLIVIFLFCFIGYRWINLDNEILDFGKTQQEYVVSDLLEHLGYKVSEEQDCAFITCMVYDELRTLNKKGVITIDSEPNINLNSKIHQLKTR